MRASIAIALIAASACGHHDATPPPATHDAPIDAAIAKPPIDWAACDAALDRAATLPDTQRAAAIITGCAVCGDWTPLLRWATPHQDGGPKRGDIEAALETCDAFCGAESKDRFLGTLDNARGLGNVTPWRWLGKVCKDKVSALPDTRFASPQLFALDRIARAAAAHGDAARLAAIALPLPPLSLSGAGVQPPPAIMLLADTPAQQITITVGEVRTGPLPRAKLGAAGVTVDLGAPPYPGDLVDPAKLAGGTYAMLAPRAMPAARVVAVVAAAPDGVLLRLGALAPDQPAEWPLVGTIAIGLAKPPPPHGARVTAPVVHVGDVPPAGNGNVQISVRKTDTVEQLAGTLDALAASGRLSVMLAIE
jgi:hypothetical protein|nr:hypothetical protein [Kofleriaceae bacterium]